MIYLKTEAEGVQIEVALQYANEYTENLHSYVNNIHTPDGGTHVIGFRTALTRTLNNYGKKEELFKDLVPSGEDFREGLTVDRRRPRRRAAVPGPDQKPPEQPRDRRHRQHGLRRVPRQVPGGKPQDGQDHRQEGPARRRGPRSGPQGQGSPPQPQGRARQRLAARQAPRLPQPATWRSASCTWSKAIRPAAAPKGAGCAQFQAILPLRGKIINAYKSREDKVLDNAEIQAMIQAIGTGIGADQDITKLRYNKIIIMTDADVDGSHIRTLLFCFFYRQMYQLVATGARLCRPAAAVSRDQGQEPSPTTCRPTRR